MTAIRPAGIRQTSGLSYRKKLIYSLVVTAAFFLVVEGLLAVLDFQPTLTDRDPFVGFESSIPLFVEQTQADSVFLQTAANKLPFFNTQTFAKVKPDHTFRVFCVGGSTTFGRPYDDTTSFVSWLRELLQVADTNQRWEVINAGGISYASYRVASVVEELCAYSPDLFIVYTGHNEFLEERTYRDLHAKPVGFRRLTAILHQTRTYSLAHQLLAPEMLPSKRSGMLSGEVDTILDHTVGPVSYERDDQLRDHVVEHFEFNVNRMVQTARSAGAEVLFVTPAANLKDFSPFKSEHRSNLRDSERQRWNELFTSAAEQERNGDNQAALTALNLAAKIDDRHADLHFRKGRLLLAEQRSEEARESFLRD